MLSIAFVRTLSSFYPRSFIKSLGTYSISLTPEGGLPKEGIFNEEGLIYNQIAGLRLISFGSFSIQGCKSNTQIQHSFSPKPYEFSV